jgi:hypothetical protein
MCRRGWWWGLISRKLLRGREKIVRVKEEGEEDAFW